MYLIFAGDNYYPAGGADDLKHICGSKQEALSEFLKLRKSDWVHVYCTDKQRIVASFHGDDARLDESFQQAD
jgi:hypothetical protein